MSAARSACEGTATRPSVGHQHWLSEPLPVPRTTGLHWFGASTVHFHLPGLLALILRQRGCQGPGREHGIALALAKPSGVSFHSSKWAKQRVMASVRGSPQLHLGCPWGVGSLTLILVGRPSPVLGVFGEQNLPHQHHWQPLPSPVLQIGHAEVPGSEAHLEGDHLAVTGALVLGGP